MGRWSAVKPTSSQAANTLLIIQGSSRAIINWRNFSIGRGEITRFVQPSSAAAVLNRVISGDPSALYGTLQGNGQVFLLKPDGILVGPGGVVNTQSFVASSLDLPNSQFLAGGTLTFKGTSPAAVVNQGQITAAGGDVFLIGNEVANSGAISAPGGTVGLAAGGQVLLAPAGQQRVFVQAAGPGGAVGVDQQGVIAAASAELQAAGGNAYALAVNSGGVVRATAVEHRGGRILLSAPGGPVRLSGTLSAKDGAKGGTVAVLGDQVTLGAGALVDVSGQAGGGTALIGGGKQGLNPAVPNARVTTVAAGARVLADGGAGGAGGTVIVWSDDHTAFAGAISARGGTAGGNGGFVEVSGQQTLDFGGTVDLRAPAGATGTLLLDPEDLTIQAAGSSTTTAGAGTFTSNVASSILTTADLQAALAFGNVLVQTGNGGVKNGDITVASAVTWASGNTLT